MKLVISDLDGTLLKSNQTISDQTRQVLKHLEEKNIKFMIATARAKRHVMNFIPFDCENIYVACYNGAEIYQGDTLIARTYLEKEVVQTIVSLLMRQYPDVNVAIEMNNALYTSFDICVMENWAPPYQQVDFSDFEFQDAAKILIDLRSIPDTTLLLNQLPESCKCLVTDGGQLAQISHVDVSKMHAIRKILQIYQIEAHETVAFGDDYNDVEMLMGCGLGVAMGNAPRDIQEMVGCATLTNEMDGVAVKLEELLSELNK